MKNIKIICTIGPTSQSEDKIRSLIEAGMNLARLNFSHGTHEDHRVLIERLKKLRSETGRNIGILQDLCGPKIRTGELPGEGIELREGHYLRLISGAEFHWDGEMAIVPVSYRHLLTDIPPGKKILLDDGQLALLVEEVQQEGLLCKVLQGGVLKSHKGVNFPGLILSEQVPTAKDLADLEFGISQGVDFVALSFVQEQSQILALKKEIQRLGGTALVIAKLERDLAIKNLDSLIQAADGIMVARGDLGIETDIAMLPIYQKLIVRKCNLLGKPVITATQMLDSMIHNPIPTRAEATDVANAIYDGSDAIMLSGESAIGKFPVQTVQVMHRIANNVEENIWLDRGWVREAVTDKRVDIDASIAHAIFKSSQEVNARLIVANTITGQTALRTAMYRPRTPILAITPRETTYYQLSLVWGIEAVYNPVFGETFDEIIGNAEQILKQTGRVKSGDIVVMTAGIPRDAPGGTNIMKLHRIR